MSSPQSGRRFTRAAGGLGGAVGPKPLIVHEQEARASTLADADLSSISENNDSLVLLGQTARSSEAEAQVDQGNPEVAQAGGDEHGDGDNDDTEEDEPEIEDESLTLWKAMLEQESLEEDPELEDEEEMDLLKKEYDEALDQVSLEYACC